MTQAQLGSDEAREELYRVMKADHSFEEKAKRALRIGERYLDVDNGHLTKIDIESDYWKAIASTDFPDESFPPGLLLDLGTTYCRRTVAQSDPVAVYDAPNQGLADDPAFQEHGLHCYHGTTITLDGEVYGTVCFVSKDKRDQPFTEEETMFAELIARMLEHELRQKRAGDRAKRLEQFTEVLSHDLRNPLQVAIARVDAAETTHESDHLAVALDALDRIDDLISDVFDMARQGQDIAETEVVALSAMARNCWQVVESSDAELLVESELRFRGAPSRLRQLFENLFRNAIEHGSEGVTIRVGPLPDRTGFYVADDGPGIPQDQRQAAFEAGFSTGEDGMGIGLAIVDGVVSAHEWNISVTESESGGARFEISDVVVVE